MQDFNQTYGTDYTYGDYTFSTDEADTTNITSRRLKSFPAGQDLRIKVYSNAKYLTLYQNGRLIDRMVSSEESSGVVWTFPAVRLKTDEDTFKVVANDGTTDQIVLRKAR